MMKLLIFNVKKPFLYSPIKWVKFICAELFAKRRYGDKPMSVILFRYIAFRHQWGFQAILIVTIADGLLISRCLLFFVLYWTYYQAQYCRSSINTNIYDKIIRTVMAIMLYIFYYYVICYFGNFAYSSEMDV